jgi:Sulfotransferase domain
MDVRCACVRLWLGCRRYSQTATCGLSAAAFLRAPPDRLHRLGEIPSVARHVATIRRHLHDRPYIETDWPHFAALPWLYEALDGRLRIVHLVRNPVETALSLATHEVYDRDDWIAEGALRPSDPGCVQKMLASRWPRMSGLERCLFWWTEIHRYACDLHRARPEIPWLTLRFERMFGPDPEPLRDLIAFCGLRANTEFERLRTQRIDRYRRRSAPQDWRAIERYPLTQTLAREFGYELVDIDGTALADRYFEDERPAHRKRWARFLDHTFWARN